MAPKILHVLQAAGLPLLVMLGPAGDADVTYDLLLHVVSPAGARSPGQHQLYIWALCPISGDENLAVGMVPPLMTGGVCAHDADDACTALPQGRHDATQLLRHLGCRMHSLLIMVVHQCVHD